MECKLAIFTSFLLKISEDDLTEVLQIEEIFSNAIQGEIAADLDLKTVFGDIDKMEMIKRVISIF